MPANQPPGYFDVTQNFDGLIFLLESSDPNILLKLSVEQERFEQAIETIRVRNNFYVNVVQPAISRESVNARSIALKEMERVLGERFSIQRLMRQGRFLRTLKLAKRAFLKCTMSFIN